MLNLNEILAGERVEVRDAAYLFFFKKTLNEFGPHMLDLQTLNPPCNAVMREQGAVYIRTKKPAPTVFQHCVATGTLCRYVDFLRMCWG